MSECVYDTISVIREPEYQKPFGGIELHEHPYNELQHPEGLYNKASFAEQTFSDGTLRKNIDSLEPQYMEIQQAESVYDKATIAEQSVFDKTLLNPESQYTELQQSEGVYDTVGVAKQKVESIPQMFSYLHNYFYFSYHYLVL